MLQKAVAHQELLLFLAFWSLPLFIIRDNTSDTRVLRVLILIALSGWIISSVSLRRAFISNLKSLNSVTKIILGTFVISACLSTLVSSEQVGTKIIGVPPEYMGLFTWLIFILIGITFANSLKGFLLSRYTLFLTAAIIASGLIYNKFYIYYGLRVSGLLYQATTMSMYAVMCVVIGLYSYRRGINSKRNDRKWVVPLSALLLVLSFITLVFTQSRVGYATFVLVVLSWALYNLKSKWAGVIIVSVSMIILSSLPHIFGNYFERFRSTNIEKGVAYRLDLYKVSAGDLIKHNIIVGYGPGVLPPGINDKDTVPPEIAKTLEQDNHFVSTHDMYFDIAYQYGVLAALGLVWLSVLAILKNYRKKSSGFLLIIFSIMIFNALFNVPSLEFTPLYFVLLFALLTADKMPTKKNSE